MVVTEVGEGVDIEEGGIIEGEDSLFDKVWVLTGELCDTILPSHKRFVAKHQACRNNSENISPNYLESAEICRSFAPVSLTI